MPSQLPDSLKPSAERLYPTVVAGVGISVNSKYEAVEVAVRGAMENAVHDCFANGDTDPALVKRMMEEARQKERKSLGLKLGLRA